jgi:hypothetical protein
MPESLGNASSAKGISVVCMGAASISDSARNGEALSSVCLMHDGNPLLLVGLGCGVLRSCLERLPSLPTAVFLPSMRLACSFDLQAYLLLAAERRTHVRVFAASEVIDRVVESLLDVESTEEIGEYSEFLEVAPGVPTEVRSSSVDATMQPEGRGEDDSGQQETADPFSITMKPCGPSVADEDISSASGSSESRAFNLILMYNEAPAVCVLEGPPQAEQLDDFSLSLRSAPLVIVKRWRSCREAQLAAFLDISTQNIFLVPGYSTRRRSGGIAAAPAIAGTVDLVSEDTVLLLGERDPSEESGDLLIDSRTPCVLIPRTAKRGSTKKPPSQPRRPPWNDTTSPGRPKESPKETSEGLIERPDELHGDPNGRLRDVAPVTGRGTVHPAEASKTWMDQWNGQHSERFENVGGFTYAGLIPRHEHRGQVFSAPPAPPKKIFLFDFDDKQCRPVGLVVQPNWSLAVIKRKVSEVANIRPIAHLVTLETGFVRSPTVLVHLQQVIVLRHGGKPFSVYDLPVNMSLPDDEWTEMQPF